MLTIIAVLAAFGLITWLAWPALVGMKAAEQETPKKGGASGGIRDTTNRPDQMI